MDDSPNPTSHQLSVDFHRLRDDIETLATIGRDPADHGIHRPALSEAYGEAQRWLEGRAREAGLSTRRDGAENVIVRYGDADETAPVVMTGSHLDSVPGGGHLDGALGVVAGLEVLRRFAELELTPTYPLELIAFTDEEGRFGGMFGSAAMAGSLTPDAIMGAQDLDGVTLVEAMQALGLDALHALRAYRHPDTVKGFVELHIEQGPVLQAEHVPIGVVEGISGLFKWNVRLRGESNHAGTTPMAMRADAFLGLAEFAGEIGRVLEEHGSDISVATIGRVALSPGAANVVPGAAEFTLEARDTHPDVLAELGVGFRRALSAIARRRSLMFEFEVMSEIDPVECDASIMQAIERAAGRFGAKTRRLPSGAAHDAQMMAELTRVGMIFVPSKDGRSHHASEWTSWDDIQVGANCLLGTLYELAHG